jgi:hypothetical protein
LPWKLQQRYLPKRWKELNRRLSNRKASLICWSCCWSWTKHLGPKSSELCWSCGDSYEFYAPFFATFSVRSVRLFWHLSPWSLPGDFIWDSGWTELRRSSFPFCFLGFHFSSSFHHFVCDSPDRAANYRTFSVLARKEIRIQLLGHVIICSCSYVVTCISVVGRPGEHTVIYLIWRWIPWQWSLPCVVYANLA